MTANEQHDQTMVCHQITVGMDTGPALVSSREWEAFFAGCIDLAAKIRQRRAARDEQAQTQQTR